MNTKKISTVEIDDSAIIFENVTFLGNCKIGQNSIIYPNSIIKDSVIGANCEIWCSVIEDSIIENKCKIGPYAHIRPNSKIGSECKIGNFVEIKNSTIGRDTKISHLAYVGDATIGKHCNIGCGAIFVNYSGKIKQQTIVGDNCFIGSNCNIIAPIKLANRTYVCAGTTLTIDTREGDFVIGRTRETIKPKRAKDYF